MCRFGIALPVLLFPLVSLAHGLEPGRGMIQHSGSEVRLMVALPVSLFASVDDDGDGRITGDDVHRHRAEVMARVRQQLTLSPAGEETLFDVGAPPPGTPHPYVRVTWHRRFANPPAHLALHTTSPLWVEVAAPGAPPAWKRIDEAHTVLWGSPPSPAWPAFAAVLAGLLVFASRRRLVPVLAMASLAACSGSMRVDAGCAVGLVTTPKPALAGAALTIRECTQTAEQVACALGTSSRFDTSTSGDSRIIQANGVPNHDVGEFPNSENPNRITAQRYDLKVPLRPAIAARPTETRIFGISFSGAVFDPATIELWNNSTDWVYEAMRYDSAAQYRSSDMTRHPMGLGVDCNYAHVQPGGQYHYHGVPTAMLPVQPQFRHVGWAGDGFPLFVRYGPGADGGIETMRSGYRLRTGPRPANGPPGNYDGTFVQDWEWQAGVGDLDVCNGKQGLVPIDGQMVQSYAYYITDTFPFIPRCWVGTPDQSFIDLGAGQVMMMPLPRCDATVRERCCGDNVCDGPENPRLCPEDCR